MSQPHPSGVPAEPTDDGALLTTGEMARRSSNTLRTVRFYEEEGILRPIRRTEGGHRLFDRRELERLLLVTDLRAAGLSLDEIRQILEVKQHATRGGDAAEVAMGLLTRRIGELREKLALLSRLQEDLTQATDIMTACVGCDDTRFPVHCDSCSVLTSQATLPRSMRVLWSTPTSPTHPTPPTPPTHPGRTGGHQT